MSIKDTIKNSVLEGFNSVDMSTTTMIVTLGIAICVGLFIFAVYRLNIKSSFYNQGLNKSLAAMPVITAGIMLAMQSNLVISLGMVGALSIVRFRNAVKEPSDLTYLFWSISSGIIVGAGLFELAIILGLCMAILLFGLDMLPTFRGAFLLVVSADLEANEDEMMACLKRYSRRINMRSRNVTKHGKEWIFELRTNQDVSIVDELCTVNGIKTVNIMTHDGEVRY